MKTIDLPNQQEALTQQLHHQLGNTQSLRLENKATNTLRSTEPIRNPLFDFIQDGLWEIK